MRRLADDLKAHEDLPAQPREFGLGLLFVITAAILGSATARGIFHVDSIMQSPGVQEIIHEWEGKGELRGARSGCFRILEAKLGTDVPADPSARLDRISDLAALSRVLVDLGTAADGAAARAIVERLG